MDKSDFTSDAGHQGSENVFRGSNEALEIAPGVEL